MLKLYAIQSGGSEIKDLGEYESDHEVTAEIRKLDQLVESGDPAGLDGWDLYMKDEQNREYFLDSEQNGNLIWSPVLPF